MDDGDYKSVPFKPAGKLLCRHRRDETCVLISVRLLREIMVVLDDEATEAEWLNARDAVRKMLTGGTDAKT